MATFLESKYSPRVKMQNMITKIYCIAIFNNHSNNNNNNNSNNNNDNNNSNNNNNNNNNNKRYKN